MRDNTSIKILYDLRILTYIKEKANILFSQLYTKEFTGISESYRIIPIYRNNTVKDEPAAVIQPFTETVHYFNLQ